MEFNPGWQKIRIQCESDNINYCAQEIGFFKSRIEKSEDDRLIQWYKYFMSVADIELEEASERLETLRTELVDYELQHQNDRMA